MITASDREREATRGHAPGAGLAIMVNANAKRGGRRVAVQIKQKLRGADVRLTKNTGEMDDWLRRIAPPKCVFAAGGDGTAIALVNGMNRVFPSDRPLPPMGVLPLGTGNAWAHVTGARKLGAALDLLEECPERIPVRKFGLIECEGTLTHFCGSGWDAQILEDFRAQLAASKGPTERLAKSVYGYVAAMLLRTVPKSLMFGRPHVIVENLGDEVFTITADGKLIRLHDARHGSILYEGLASVAACSTCPEFGYRFRAFPFAERLLGAMNVRIYNQLATAAVATIPALWRGAHPLPGMHDWFATHIRMTFSRPVPLEIGGDACGMRRTIEFKASPRLIDVLDWRRM